MHTMCGGSFVRVLVSFSDAPPRAIIPRLCKDPSRSGTAGIPELLCSAQRRRLVRYLHAFAFTAMKAQHDLALLS